jgi:hypothetical protein
MTYRSDSEYVGHPPITDLSTTAKVPVGTIIKAHDDDGGGAAEFIYLQGVASTTAGSIVEYNSSYQTGLANLAAGVPSPLAVAMAACTASYYGWYQIAGEATVAKASGASYAADAAFGVSAGLAIAAATTLRVANGVVNTAASGASAVVEATVMINRPAGPSSD